MMIIIIMKKNNNNDNKKYLDFQVFYQQNQQNGFKKIFRHFRLTSASNKCVK